jgi:peptidoglycan/LPS O-acetylase OafA/YrhL
MKTTKTRLHNLDSLRGVAALSILVSHWTNYWDHTSLSGSAGQVYQATGEFLSRLIFGGHRINVAVLIFIVLSGFIVNYTTKSMGGGMVDGWRRQYLLKRSAKIMPVYFLALCSSLIVGLFAHNSFSQLITVVPHFFFLYGLIPIPSFQLNAPLVTVESEILLYCFFWVVCPWLNSKKRWGIALVLCLFVHLLNKYIQHQYYSNTLTTIDDYWFNHSFFGFLLFWMMGAASSELFIKGFRFSPVIPLIIWMIDLVLKVRLSIDAAYHDFFIATAVSFLLINLATAQNQKNFSLSKAGEFSYSVYAFHFPLLIFFTDIFYPFSADPLGSLYILLTVLAICIFLSKTIEFPLQRMILSLFKKGS